MPVTAALAGAGFGQSSRLGRYGGLFQRASIITGSAWLTTVSARALDMRPEPRSAQGTAAACIGGSGIALG
jgi:hypothetical protein